MAPTLHASRTAPTSADLTLTVCDPKPEFAGRRSARFGKAGGFIGRGDFNHLVLPDPERRISRRHAQILYRDRRYWIVAHGLAPLNVNSNDIHSGSQHPLSDGDIVRIGVYVLLVRIIDATETQETPALGTVGESLASRPQSPPQRLPDDFDPFAAPLHSEPRADEHPLGLQAPLGDPFAHPAIATLASVPADDSTVKQISDLLCSELLKQA
jgi:predicted component of type VI protein secretion system